MLLAKRALPLCPNKVELFLFMQAAFAEEQIVVWVNSCSVVFQMELTLLV